MEKPGWKTEAVKGKLVETKFDKWMLLAQVVYQIVVWDTPITKKLQRTEELLSHLTLEEKEMFQITEDDEEGLRVNYGLIKYYDNVLSYPQVFTGKTWVTSKNLTVEEKCNYLSKPKRGITGWSDSFSVDWDKRTLTLEGEKKLIEDVIEKKGFTVFAVPVDPRDVYCKLESFKRENDGWNPHEDGDDDDYSSYQFYSKNKKLDFGKDDPLIWCVAFYVKNRSLLPQVKHAYRQYVLEARKLIGSILQRMMKQLEGKTVYVIPEERKIP